VAKIRQSHKRNNEIELISEWPNNRIQQTQKAGGILWKFEMFWSAFCAADSGRYPEN
jgi:hypothetical protein